MVWPKIKALQSCSQPDASLAGKNAAPSARSCSHNVASSIHDKTGGRVLRRSTKPAARFGFAQQRLVLPWIARSFNQ